MCKFTPSINLVHIPLEMELCKPWHQWCAPFSWFRFGCICPQPRESPDGVILIITKFQGFHQDVVCVFIVHKTPTNLWHGLIYSSGSSKRGFYYQIVVRLLLDGGDKSDQVVGWQILTRWCQIIVRWWWDGSDKSDHQLNWVHSTPFLATSPPSLHFNKALAHHEPSAALVTLSSLPPATLPSSILHLLIRSQLYSYCFHPTRSPCYSQIAILPCKTQNLSVTTPLPISLPMIIMIKCYY